MDEETKQLIVGMAKDIGTLKSDVGCMKSDVADIRREFGSDIRSLKSDVGSLKSDVADMRQEFGSDIRSLKSDVGTLKSEVGSLSYKMDSLQFDLNCFREETDVNFSLVNGEFSRLECHIDGFASQSVRFDTEDAATRSRQDRMEERLDRLERKIR